MTNVHSSLTQASLLKASWKLKPDLVIEVSCGEPIPILSNFYFEIYRVAFFLAVRDTLPLKIIT